MKQYASETEKYLHLTTPYCNGSVLDIGSQGHPVVPWAIQLEQPAAQFKHYCGGLELPRSIHLQGDARDLPFKDGVLDAIYCSHVIEDFDQNTWPDMFREWRRCLKVGGYIIVLVPEVTLWNEAIKNGQPPNCSHFAPEPSVGDLTRRFQQAGHLKVIKDELTNVYPGDYSILGIAQRTR